MTTRDFYCAACQKTHVIPAYEIEEPETWVDVAKGLVVMTLILLAIYSLVILAAVKATAN